MNRQRGLLGLAGVGVFLVCVIQLTVFSFGRDQSIYAVVGEGILHGKLPYRDLWDFKPPGIFLVYALAQALFGHTMLAPRLLEIAGLGVMAASFIFLAQRWFGSRLIGIWAAALTAFVHSQLDFWHTGQPEAFGAMLTAIGLALAVHEEGAKRPPGHWLAIGFVFGLAGLMKPHLAAGALVVAAYLYARRHAANARFWRAFSPVLVVGAAALLPIGLTGFWFWSQGAWPALKWTLFEFAPGYTALTYGDQSALRLFYSAVEEGSFRFSAIVGVGLLLAFALPAHHRREREGLFVLLGVCLLHFAGIAMQSKFYQYHFSATLPFLALIASVGFGKFWSRLASLKRVRLPFFVGVLVLLALMRLATNDVPLGYWTRASERLRFLASASTYPDRSALDAALYHVGGYDIDDNQRVSRTIARLTSADESVYVWGFEPSLYWLSERQSASRFIYNVPQRAAWQSAEARRLLLQDLERNPPRLIVVQRHDIFPSVVGNSLDSEQFLTHFGGLTQLLDTHYERVTQTDRFDVYRRRSI